MKKIKINKNRIKAQLFRLALLSLVFIVFHACEKDKLDFEYDNRKVTDEIAASNMRIVNLSSFYNQLIVNGDSLTNYTIPDLYGYGDEYPPTYYFPEDGRLSNMWEVPQELLDENGSAKMIFENMNLYKDSAVVREDYDEPKDYYLWCPEPYYQKVETGEAPQEHVAEIPRSLTGPSKPDHFKIRLVNLSVRYDDFGIGTEVLDGPFTLAYADGTPVSATTSNISQGEWSGYVEVPYGTYQFKVLTTDQRQLPAPGMDPNEVFDRVDPPTSAIAASYQTSSYLTYAPVRTFQPGGIYTIAVSPGIFLYIYDSFGNEANFIQNAYQVIPDNTVPANVSYARLQGVHALTGQPTVTLKVNQNSLDGMAFGEASGYRILTAGNYQLEAIDASGQALASLDVKLQAGSNYSAWIWPGPDGNPQISVVSNNLSGTWYNPSGNDGDDASLSRYVQQFPMNVRFLNLCPDEPYITFTKDNGSLLTGSFGSDGTAAQNIQPGVIPVEAPYFNMSTFHLLAYRSQPSVVPGTWADDIAPLSSADFIARPELYEVRGHLPGYEPGVYTVALVGSSQSGIPAEYQKRMIIIKHTK